MKINTFQLISLKYYNVILSSQGREDTHRKTDGQEYSIAVADKLQLYLQWDISSKELSYYRVDLNSCVFVIFI